MVPMASFDWIAAGIFPKLCAIEKSYIGHGDTNGQQLDTIQHGRPRVALERRADAARQKLTRRS